MAIREVAASRGWQWIAEGFALFRKSPAIWVALILVLYVVLKVLVRVPILGIIFFLFIPAVLAGLMEGCKAIESGEGLKVGHLWSGFQKNVANLVTLGGIWLVGNLLLSMLIFAISGDALMTMMKHASGGAGNGGVTSEAVAGAAPRVMMAALIAMMFSLPLLMALWFAPLLVHFKDYKPVQALTASFIACWKNVLPFLVYGLLFFVGTIILTPITIMLGQVDLSVWLLAPVLTPSIYASYKDIFAAVDPTPAGGGNPFPR